MLSSEWNLTSPSPNDGMHGVAEVIYMVLPLPYSSPSERVPNPIVKIMKSALNALGMSNLSQAPPSVRVQS